MPNPSVDRVLDFLDSLQTEPDKTLEDLVNIRSALIAEIEAALAEFSEKYGIAASHVLIPATGPAELWGTSYANTELKFVSWVKTLCAARLT